MYSKELIETYMSRKNYTQQKQMAADMKISQAYLSDIYTGKRHFTEESAIWIATECGLQHKEVLMKLAASKAKTAEAQSIWAEVVKTYCTGHEAAAGAGLAMMAALTTSLHNFALYILC